MGDWSAGVVVFVALTFLLAGFLKGALGFGSNLLAIPLLALVVEPRVAIALSVLPSVAALPLIFWRLGVRPVEARRIAPFLLALGPGTVAGAVLLVSLSRGVVAAGVGLLAIGFALLSALRLQPRLPPRREPVVTPLAGLACGLIGGAASVHGPAVACYLHSLGLEKRAFVVAFACVFCMTSAVQLVSYLLLGVYTPLLLLGSLLACVPATLGTHLGIHAQQHLHQAWFNRLVLGLIFASGVSLIVR